MDAVSCFDFVSRSLFIASFRSYTVFLELATDGALLDLAEGDSSLTVFSTLTICLVLTTCDVHLSISAGLYSNVLCDIVVVLLTGSSS